MTSRKLLLEDTFEYQEYPFLVKVEQFELFIHADTDEVRKMNVYQMPAGTQNPDEWVPGKPYSKKWVLCECIVATVRPEYERRPTASWPENVGKHFKTVIPLEYPSKEKGWIRTKYFAEKCREREEVDVQTVAKMTIGKLYNAYKERVKVEELEAEV